MDARQVGRMEQGLALVPKMLQSIEVLQLTSAELLAKIDQELERNETLVATDPEPPALPEPASTDESEFEPEVWRAESAARSAGSEDLKRGFLENQPDRDSASLVEHVQGQLSWLDLAPEVFDGVCSLASRLDHRGLLTSPEEELLEVLDRELLDECVGVLRSLEPKGIGARDPISAMLSQVSERDPDLSDITAMLTRHLDALAKNKIPEVARSLGRTVEEVRELLGRIKKLDPHPGAPYVPDAVGESVHPDAVVRYVDGRIEVEIDEMKLPDLGIHADYEEIASGTTTDRDTRRYLKDKLRSARDLIDAVHQRRRTLARTVMAVMLHQREFLQQGRLAVQTLSMSQIAEELELHPSTISRAISSKFVQTDHGIFRLRDFFDGDRRAGAETGAGAGRLAIRDHIRDLIAHEDPSEPLSDDEIVRRLLGRNIKVARRTVAKYRVELGLGSSWRRKNHEEGT